jgi:peptide deformylase
VKRKAYNEQRGNGDVSDIVTVQTKEGRELLYRRAQEVVYTPEVKSWAENMVERLRELGAQGLAAPQCGGSMRIIVVETRPTELKPHIEPSGLYVMLNPVIEKRFGPVVENFEGCLILPGMIYENIPRYYKVRVRYLDLEGRMQRCTVEEHLATVLQHEGDHLNGILCKDRAHPRKGVPLEEFRRRHRA